MSGMHTDSEFFRQLPLYSSHGERAVNTAAAAEGGGGGGGGGNSTTTTSSSSRPDNAATHAYNAHGDYSYVNEEQRGGTMNANAVIVRGGRNAYDNNYKHSEQQWSSDLDVHSGGGGDIERERGRDVVGGQGQQRSGSAHSLGTSTNNKGKRDGRRGIESKNARDKLVKMGKKGWQKLKPSMPMRNASRSVSQRSSAMDSPVPSLHQQQPRHQHVRGNHMHLDMMSNPAGVDATDGMSALSLSAESLPIFTSSTSRRGFGNGHKLSVLDQVREKLNPVPLPQQLSEEDIIPGQEEKGRYSNNSDSEDEQYNNMHYADDSRTRRKGGRTRDRHDMTRRGARDPHDTGVYNDTRSRRSSLSDHGTSFPGGSRGENTGGQTDRSSRRSSGIGNVYDNGAEIGLGAENESSGEGEISGRRERGRRRRENTDNGAEGSSTCIAVDWAGESALQDVLEGGRRHRLDTPPLKHEVGLSSSDVVLLERLQSGTGNNIKENKKLVPVSSSSNLRIRLSGDNGSSSRDNGQVRSESERSGQIVDGAAVGSQQEPLKEQFQLDLQSNEEDKEEQARKVRKRREMQAHIDKMLRKWGEFPLAFKLSSSGSHASGSGASGVRRIRRDGASAGSLSALGGVAVAGSAETAMDKTTAERLRRVHQRVKANEKRASELAKRMDALRKSTQSDIHSVANEIENLEESMFDVVDMLESKGIQAKEEARNLRHNLEADLVEKITLELSAKQDTFHQLVRHLENRMQSVAMAHQNSSSSIVDGIFHRSFALGVNGAGTIISIVAAVVTTFTNLMFGSQQQQQANATAGEIVGAFLGDGDNDDDNDDDGDDYTLLDDDTIDGRCTNDDVDGRDSDTSGASTKK